MAIPYHESYDALSDATKDIHRALSSLTEEIEAIDWYTERIDVASDIELRDILDHNRTEEAEHLAMVLEYLRRKLPLFDAPLRTYLFTEAPILQIEKQATASPEPAAASADGAAAHAPFLPGDLQIRKPDML